MLRVQFSVVYFPEVNVSLTRDLVFSFDVAFFFVRNCAFAHRRCTLFFAKNRVLLQSEKWLLVRIIVTSLNIALLVVQLSFRTRYNT